MTAGKTLTSFFDFSNYRPVTIWDLLDVLIVWLLIYYLFRFMRGRRTLQMAFGLLALYGARLLAEKLNLVVVSIAIGSLFKIIPFAIIVVFQDEIRGVLATIGTTPFLSRSQGTQNPVLDSIFLAVRSLSKTRTGALIVIEGKQGLRNYIEKGSRLDALVNPDLLIDIFNPKSTLHDGAVIISNSRIAGASCIMPLTRSLSIPKHFGTRHLAAIGISEEVDCIVIVVSEETGKISVAQNGKIFTMKAPTQTQLYETYNNLLLPEGAEKSSQLRPVKRNPLRRVRFLRKMVVPKKKEADPPHEPDHPRKERAAAQQPEPESNEPEPQEQEVGK